MREMSRFAVKTNHRRGAKKASLKLEAEIKNGGKRAGSYLRRPRAFRLPGSVEIEKKTITKKE